MMLMLFIPIFLEASGRSSGGNVFSQVTTVKRIQEIPWENIRYGKRCIVILDICKTLLDTRYIATLLSFFKHLTSEHVNNIGTEMEWFFNRCTMVESTRLVWHDIPLVIGNLKAAGHLVFTYTNVLTGQVPGEKPGTTYEEQIYQKLVSHNIFLTTFNNEEKIYLAECESAQPLYYKGIFLNDKSKVKGRWTDDKGRVFKRSVLPFLKTKCNLSEYPGGIIYVDDIKKHVDALGIICKESGIPFQGFYIQREKGDNRTWKFWQW